MKDDTKDCWFTPAVIVAAATGNISNVIAASTQGGIERQEAQGQRDMIRNARLPIPRKDDKQIFEKMGIVFKDKEGLFFNVELPTGLVTVS